MNDRSDEQLLSDYRQGTAGALRILIERHQADLLRFLTRLMGSRDGAEDVFQEAFLQVHISCGSFDETRRFRPWLFTIAANKARDALRKKGRRPTVDLQAPISGGGRGSDTTTFIDLMEVDVPAPDAAIDDQERNRLVQEALARMSHPLREILVLSYFQRLSYAQIAEDLEIPLGTVKSRLHAAVAAFASQWRAVNTPGGLATSDGDTK